MFLAYVAARSTGLWQQTLWPCAVRADGASQQLRPVLGCGSACTGMQVLAGHSMGVDNWWLRLVLFWATRCCNPCMSLPLFHGCQLPYCCRHNCGELCRVANSRL